MATIDVKEEVRKRYGAIAEASGSCCGSTRELTESKRVGYSDEDLSAVPEGANLGLGCGNPLALAALQEGQTVLDLGSGAGFDAFLAANRVGPTGHVIGVDMTDAMLEKARANAKKGGYDHVEFRKGEIETLPVDDNSVDVVISNCVINLSPDKPAVFAEAHRVLKPGGRAYISDIVLLEPLPESIRTSIGAYTACVGGAVLKDDYLQAARDAGFAKVAVTHEKSYADDSVLNSSCCGGSAPAEGTWLSTMKDVPREDLIKAARAVVSVKVELEK